MQIDVVEDFIEEAKMRLRAWGAEERRQLRVEMNEVGEPSLKGWDSQTIAHTIMRHGGRAPTGTGSRKESENPEVIETDRIVTTLFQLHPAGDAIRDALYLHYVFKVSYRQGARMTHKSARAYRDLLESGQSWLAGGLAATV